MEAKILVVDEDGASRRALFELVREEGFLCFEAAHTAGALKFLKQESIDVLLVDTRVASQKDFLLLRAASHHSDLRVILIGAANPPGPSLAIAELVLSGQLRKPPSRTMLKREIGLALERRNQRVNERERIRTLEDGLRRLRADLERLGRAAGVFGSSSEVPDLRALSQRELEVLDELLKGERVSAIARKLYLSPHTIRNHLSSIFRKTGTRSQAELMGKLRTWDGV